MRGKIESIKYHIAKYRPTVMFISEADTNPDALGLP